MRYQEPTYTPKPVQDFFLSTEKRGSELKRYRYIGKERDEETGFYYCGARYYVPWLCRWMAVDPMQSKMAEWSPYNYSYDNPIKFTDKTGMQPDDNVRIYGNAEVTKTTLTDKGGTQDYPKGAISYKDALLVPALNKDNSIVGYNIFEKPNKDRD